MFSLHERSARDNLALPICMGSGGVESAALCDSRENSVDIRLTRKCRLQRFLGGKTGIEDERGRQGTIPSPSYVLVADGQGYEGVEVHRQL